MKMFAVWLLLCGNRLRSLDALYVRRQSSQRGADGPSSGIQWAVVSVVKLAFFMLSRSC